MRGSWPVLFLTVGGTHIKTQDSKFQPSSWKTLNLRAKWKKSWSQKLQFLTKIGGNAKNIFSSNFNMSTSIRLPQYNYLNENNLNGRRPQRKMILNGRQPQLKTTYFGRRPHLKDDLNRIRTQWKTISVEDNLSGRQPQWKTTKLEDNLDERQPQWKTTSIEDNLI